MSECTCHFQHYIDAKCLSCLQKIEDKACVWLFEKGILTTVQKTVLVKFCHTYPDSDNVSVYLSAASVARAMGWNE